MVTKRSQRLASRLAGRLWRRRDGSAAAEFALIVPLLGLFLFGVMQYGLLVYSYGSMLNGARAGARQLAFGLTTEAQAEAAVAAQMPPWIGAAATVTATANDAGLSRVAISVPAARASIIALGPLPATVDVDITMPRVND